MTTSSAPPPSTGPLAAAITDAIARLLSERIGRGPTHGRTTIDDDLVVSVQRDMLTASERTLIAGGRGDVVLHTRRQHHALMRAELVGTVEALTGRRVTAFLNDSHLDPDVSVEVFVLEPVTSGERTSG